MSIWLFPVEDLLMKGTLMDRKSTPYSLLTPLVMPLYKYLKFK
jgi:hypothetical protein